MTEGSSANQLEQRLFAQPSRRLGSVEQVGGHVALVSMQAQDAFLDAVLHDQAIDRHRPGLTDSVSAVGGLILEAAAVKLKVIVDAAVTGEETLRVTGRLSCIWRSRRRVGWCDTSARLLR